MRQKLLAQQRFRKYLFYALGEIIFIVIGILLALSINNWNQNRLAAKEELKLLNSLLSELQNNSHAFDFTFSAQKIRLESIQQSLTISSEAYSNGYIDTLIMINSDSYTFNPSFGIYNSIINSGKIELITNNTLKNRIATLSDLIQDYQEEEKVAEEFTNLFLYKYFLEEFPIDPLILGGQKTRTMAAEIRDKMLYTEVMDSDKLRKMWLLLLRKMNNIDKEGLLVKTEFQTLITLLEQEIISKER